MIDQLHLEYFASAQEIEFLLSLVLDKVTSYHVPSLTRVEVLSSQVFQCIWPWVLAVVLTPTYRRHPYLDRLSDRNHLTRHLVHSLLLQSRDLMGRANVWLI
jgi:hypothetical protein